MALLVTLVGMLGGAIGSFLNVVVHRVPAGISVIHPPSACPYCSSRIRPYDNIPVVSWLVLRGRCRECRAPISARYPALELATAVAFAAIAGWRLEGVVNAASTSSAVAELTVLVALLYFAAVTIALAVIDLDVHRLPNVMVLPAYAVVGSLLLVAALVGGDIVAFARALAGSGILFAFYFLVAVVAPRGMGMGDVKLAGVLGMMLGWFGWGSLAVGGFSAFVLGGLVGIALIAIRKARRTTAIPFGPWMLAGAWVGIVAGEALASGYVTFIGLG